MRRPVLAAVTVVAATVLTACAGIPTDGPVRSVRSDDDAARTTVRYSPAGPRVGASPEEIVRGYLDAMLAYPITTATASEYLTPSAAAAWRAGRSTTVYGPHTVAQVASRPDESDAEDGTVGASVVRLRAATKAVLGSTGRYATGDDVDLRLRLVRIRGQWRIANPPAGTMVSTRFFEDYYRPFDIYFFDRPGERLVPQVVHLPVGGQLPTALVAALAAGPSDTRFLRSYVPSRSSLRPSVPVSNGTADVAFTVDLGSRERGRLNRLAAQVVWTLRQVPELSGVRVNGGTAVVSPSGQPVNQMTDWGRFGPPGSSSVAYALVRNRVRQLDGGRLARIPGPWGEDARGATRVAVGDESAAGVVDGGTAVRVQSLDGGRPRIVPGEDVRALTWDAVGRLWVVDRPGGRTRVRAGSPSDLRTIPTTGLGDLGVTTVAVSPDGGNVLLSGRRSGRDTVVVAPVARDGSGDPVRVGTPRRLAAGVVTVRAAGWLEPSVVEVLGGTRLGLQVRQVSLDGSGLTSGVGGGAALAPDLDLDRLVRGSAADPPRWAIDRRGRLWYLPPGQTWELVPSARVTDLSTSP